MGVRIIQLENDLQTELSFTRRSKRINARTDSYPVDQMSRIVGAVDAAGATRQQARHHARWQIEIGKVR